MPKTHKPRLVYGEPVAPVKTDARFEPIPGEPSHQLSLSLNMVVPESASRIDQANRLVFHCVGDTGNSHEEVPRRVSDAMERQIREASVDERPAFFYHLGDVVYHHGKGTKYREQFYKPFKFYPAPIFAIPGNHDGDPPDSEPSLTGFRTNFCSTQPTPLYPHRDTMTQPYVYWRFETPFADIIGLYSNVEGMLDQVADGRQERWLVQQLRQSPKEKCVLLAVHHPPYSLDDEHGGSPLVGEAIDRAIAAADHAPAAVLAGHSHCYQRFTRSHHGRQIPYLVAGAGGHADNEASMGSLTRDDAKQPPSCPFKTKKDGVVLEAYEENHPGFLRMTITREILQGQYFRVPFTGEPPAEPADQFELKWKEGVLR